MTAETAGQAFADTLQAAAQERCGADVNRVLDFIAGASFAIAQVQGFEAVAKALNAEGGEK